MSLASEQEVRYARQLLLPEVGPDGQERLGRSSVLVIGLGGLGSPVAYYLAAAGIGRLGLADADRVELSNLQRQLLHSTDDLGRLKHESAAEKLRRLNPHVDLAVYSQRVTAENFREIAGRFDFVVDATDNFTSKFMLSDQCVAMGKAFNHAGVSGFSGQSFTYVPNKGCGCYRCLFLEPPLLPDQARGGILGAVAGLLGTIQAVEALKYLLGVSTLLTNRLLICDGLRMQFREVRFNPRPGCPACGSMA